MADHTRKQFCGYMFLKYSFGTIATEKERKQNMSYVFNDKIRIKQNLEKNLEYALIIWTIYTVRYCLFLLF